MDEIAVTQYIQTQVEIKYCEYENDLRSKHYLTNSEKRGLPTELTI